MLNDAARVLLDAEHLLMKSFRQSDQQRDADAYMPELFTIRGKICVRRGQRTEAKNWFDKALQIDGSYEDAKLQIRNLHASGMA
jgi:predicted negative regulator of RcsB-dependent stress response